MPRDDTQLTAIYDRVVETADKVGQLNGRLHSIETEVLGTREAVVKQGLAVAQLQVTCAGRAEHCERRFKRLSEAVGTVREDTGAGSSARPGGH